MHWGPYAVPEVSSEKYPKGIYQKSWREGEVWDFHRANYGDPSKFGYKDLIPLFKAEKFNADEWIQLFKQSGAKYVVPVGEHHDGYAMYNSHYTRWNVVQTGPKKDIMKLLSDACKTQGMKFGISSHYALNRAYYSHEDPTWDTNNPEFYDLYNEPVERNSLPTKKFLNMWWNRTTDIIDNYQPDLLWFDFGLDKPGFESVHKKILSYYYNKGLDWNKGVVFQDKNMGNESFPKDLIVLDIERGRMDGIYELPWQTDTSIGKKSWGYIKDEEYKTSNYLIDELIDIVSKNGCLLLNIGPKADGTIPAEAKKILTEMGEWLNPNSEAIFSTRPWKIYGEGPTKVSKGHHSEGENAEATFEDIRFTTKGDILYAIALDWSKNGNFNVKSLATGNKLELKKVKSVELIGGKKVSWKQTSEGLQIKVNEDKSKQAALAFKIEFKN